MPITHLLLSQQKIKLNILQNACFKWFLPKNIGLNFDFHLHIIEKTVEYYNEYELLEIIIAYLIEICLFVYGTKCASV